MVVVEILRRPLRRHEHDATLDDGHGYVKVKWWCRSE